jgi:hypothetical protein
MLKSRMIKWAGHVASMVEKLHAKFFVGKPAGRPRRRLEDNIKMGLTEIGWEVVDGIRSVQDRGQWRAHMNMAVKLR